MSRMRATPCPPFRGEHDGRTCLVKLRRLLRRHLLRRQLAFGSQNLGVASKRAHLFSLRGAGVRRRIRVPPRQPEMADSIREWLDSDVKAGYGAKFASAFEEVGIEDVSDLSNDEEYE